MNEHTEEALREQLNERLKQPARIADYDYVRVLLLHWDGPTEGALAFRNEGRDLGRFFTEIFKFPAVEYAIPLDNSDLSLQKRITDEVLLASQAAQSSLTPSLLIIHYGGHGDSDTDGAVWAASATAQEDESLVHWNSIQRTLEHSKADILLLLDCCFSAHAGRARKKTSRIEVLTASSKKEQTPLPGPKSFTSAMIKSIGDSIKAEGYITVEKLHAELLNRKAELLTTPVNFALRPGFPDRSIRLAPSGDATAVLTERELPSSYIRLIIRTTELSHDNVDELISWLRSDLPNNVSLEVESIARTTATIQGLIQSIPQKNPPLMRNLDTNTLDNILTTWTTVSGLLSQYKARRDSLRGTDKYMEQLQQQAHKLLEQLRLQNAEIVDTVEQGVLQSPEVLDMAKLGEVINDPTAKSLGIADQLQLRHMIGSSNNQAAEDLRDRADAPKSGGISVWKEFKKYGKYLDPAHLPEVEARVALLAELLNASKSPAFCSLKCSLWYHDQPQDQFVLEFDVPDEYKFDSGAYRSWSLKTIVKKVTGFQRPSLGQRLRMAFSIAKAVRQWHSVGWVHQSISGHNLIFFERSESEIDYNKPFLQGFDFARPNVSPSIGRYVDDISHNVYRHPDRQGPTRKGHKKIHDMYSLGVVLLEIGLWEDACTTAGAKKGRDLAIDKMKSNLQTAATNRLAHYAGKDYQEAVLACLTSDFGVEEDDEEGSRLLRAFQNKVLDNLAKGSALR